MIVELAVDDLAGSGANGIGEVPVELAEVLVRGRGGVLDHAEGAEDGAGHALAADAEVLERALGLGAPVAIGGDLDGPHRVGLGAGVGHVGLHGRAGLTATVSRHEHPFARAGAGRREYADSDRRPASRG